MGDFKFLENFPTLIPRPLALDFISCFYRFCALWDSRHTCFRVRDAVGLTRAPCSQLSLWPAWMKARSWMFLNETQLAWLPSAGLHWVSAAHCLHRQGGPFTNNNMHMVPKSQASSQLDQLPNLLHHTAKWHLCQIKAKGRAGGGREAELHSWFCFFSCSAGLHKFEMPGDCQVLW